MAYLAQTMSICANTGNCTMFEAAAAEFARSHLDDVHLQTVESAFPRLGDFNDTLAAGTISYEVFIGDRDQHNWQHMQYTLLGLCICAGLIVVACIAFRRSPTPSVAIVPDGEKGPLDIDHKTQIDGQQQQQHQQQQQQ
jgi:hypothetical protein